MDTSRFTPTRSIALLALLVAAGCKSGGDGDPTTPNNESIGIVLSASTLSIVQGQNGSVTVTLTRNGGYAGAVSLALENAPTGVTGTFTPASLSGTAATSSLAITVPASASATTSNLVIRATGSGVSAQTAPLTLTVTGAPTGGYTLSLSSTTLNLVQGTGGAVTVSVNRTAPFTGAVSVAPVSLPAGITMTPNPASIAGASTSTSVTFNVAASVAPGSNSIVLRGTGTGAPDQQVTLNIQVTPPSTGGTSVTITFCQADAPIWVGSQSETGPWIRATSTTANTYTFNISNRGGFAAVYNASGGGYRVEFTYGTASELTTTGPQCLDPTGSKAVTGTVATLTAADEAYVSLGASETTRMGAGAFQLLDVAEGPLDLLAVRSPTTTSSITPNKMIFRRNVNQANNSAIPVLDFGSAEAFDPSTGNITIGNLGSDFPFLFVLLTTMTGGTGVYYIGGLFGGGSVQPWYGVPESRLTTGDLHNAIAFGANQAGDALRAAYVWARQVNNRTVTLGPVIATPTVSVASTTPYLRHRAQFARQSEYGQAALIQFDQNSDNGGPNYRLVSIQASAAYFGAGTTWDITVPDLSAAAGFLTTWGLQGAVPVSYSTGAIGGTGDINAYPVDGLTLSIAFRVGNAASSQANVGGGDTSALMRRVTRGWSWLRRF